MIDFSKNKYNCSGCTACYAACPMNCIFMKKDEEGFLYPVASDECIHCGKCEKVCPRINEVFKNDSFTQKAYAAITKDMQVWKRSASGGAFSEICKAWDDGNTIFVGATWDGLNVHHIAIDRIEDIAPLCKSKYVASSMDDCFSTIKENLLSGKKIVFCGTPCQVAGLKSFLGKDYESLLLIDLICHGVGSPDVFVDCIKLMNEQFDMNIEKYEFRHKRNYTFETRYLGFLASHEKEIVVTNDQYIQLFLEQTCLRPSCGEHCIYRNEKRQGDITIADFNGLEKVFPELRGTKQNYSSIVINTTKGNKVVDVLRENMELYECSVDDIKEYNPLFTRQTWFSDNRSEFFDEYSKEGKECIKKYTSNATIYHKSVKKVIYDFLPVPIRKRILSRYEQK